MANGLPRSQLRAEWQQREHFAALDDDIDTMRAEMRDGFQLIANQLEANRRTWRWGVTAMIALATLVLAGVALVVR